MKRAVREKGPNAFRTIGEAAEEVGVAAHVLRFWESKFPALQPLKRGGSRRYYRPRDIELLHRIKRLLHSEGYTIKGAAKALRNGNAAAVPAAMEAELPLELPAADARPATASSELERIRDALETLAAECAGVAAGNSPPPRSD